MRTISSLELVSQIVYKIRFRDGAIPYLYSPSSSRQTSFSSMILQAVTLSAILFQKYIVV